MKLGFSGWATKNDLRCSDGRTIRKDAFKENDGKTVPLVWNHQHNDPNNILGHAQLENREEGVYAYCVFNDTESGQLAKNLVKHGDVCALSIYANQLKQQGGRGDQPFDQTDRQHQDIGGQQHDLAQQGKEQVAHGGSSRLRRRRPAGRG